MAIESTSVRSRRTLLLGALGGAAAAAAATLARIAPVTAADGQALVIGQANGASSATSLTSSGPGLSVEVGGTDNAITALASNGIALVASTDSTDGLALATLGRVRMREISGVATIRKGRRTVTVRPVEGIHGKPFVLLTPQSDIGTRGLWCSIEPATGTFSIRMSSARRGPTRVAWLILER